MPGVTDGSDGVSETCLTQTKRAKIMQESIYLVYLSLNHDDPITAYESLENFLDTQQRMYLYVAGANRALVVWSALDRTRLERDLLKYCMPGMDHVVVRQMEAGDRLPAQLDPLIWTKWLSQRTDWWQWRGNFPDSSDLPQTTTHMPQPGGESTLLPAPRRTRRLSMERIAS